MAQNPLNLALRFVLELTALFALGYWGWIKGNGILSLVLAIGLPLLAAALWGTFSVPGDRPGTPPVPVPGIVRLVVEVIIFGGATLALYTAGRGNWGLVFASVVLIHYAISYDRIFWLLKQ